MRARLFFVFSSVLEVTLEVTQPTNMYHQCFTYMHVVFAVVAIFAVVEMVVHVPRHVDDVHPHHMGLPPGNDAHGEFCLPRHFPQRGQDLHFGVLVAGFRVRREFEPLKIRKSTVIPILKDIIEQFQSKKPKNRIMTGKLLKG